MKRDDAKYVEDNLRILSDKLWAEPAMNITHVEVRPPCEVEAFISTLTSEEEEGVFTIHGEREDFIFVHHKNGWTSIFQGDAKPQWTDYHFARMYQFREPDSEYNVADIRGAIEKYCYGEDLCLGHEPASPSVWRENISDMEGIFSRHGRSRFDSAYCDFCVHEFRPIDDLPASCLPYFLDAIALWRLTPRCPSLDPGFTPEECWHRLASAMSVSDADIPAKAMKLWIERFTDPSRAQPSKAWGIDSFHLVSIAVNDQKTHRQYDDMRAEMGIVTAE